MKKAFILALSCLIAAGCSGFALALESAPAHSAQSAILLHGDTGTVLYSHNADEAMLVASTTKVMTALVVLENALPDAQVEIQPQWCGIEGSSVYLSAGQLWTVEELLYGLLLASGNDAATALACYVAGSVEGFAELMNHKASQLGLQNTHFVNPHGLDAQDHYSSARDLALITAEAMKNTLFAEIVSTKSITLGENTYANHNKMLWNYPGTLGVKTGYTMAAGRSLITCAQRDGLKLICVTLNAPDDWNDHSALLDWGFANYRYENVLPSGELARLPVISGALESVGVAADGQLRLLLEKDAVPEMKLELPRFVYAEIKAGSRAGAVEICVDDKVAGRVELCYTQSVPFAQGVRLTAWEKLKRAWYMANRYSGIRYGYYGVM